GQYASTDSFKSIFDWDFVIIELTKAPKNPYAGRTILDLYMPEGNANAIVSDAMIRFNETNKKCFIRITDRYYGRYYQSVDYMASEDEDVITQSKKDADFSYDLANDLLNGEGPDILMNTCALGQLNNPDYLIDLSPYVQDLDPDKYFTNIVEGAKTDGKLYQLPVCYTLKGIQTSKELAGRSGTGFTTGEYKDFLYGTLNGGDVIEVTQIPYFAKLFNNMRDAFIKDGKADLTGPEFAELAQYVKDNVKQVRLPKSEENEEDPMAIDDPVFLKSNKALYCNCPGITGYLVKRARLKEATTILGIPSADGRGPLFGTNVSVAVSANAVNKDACIEFIKMLLTDEIQTEFVMNDRFVLNKEALRQGFAKAVGFYNTKEGQRNIYDYTAGTNATINTKFTDEDLNNLENVILSCSGADSVDAAINMILIEEMPAYFAGQKTLDQVIPVMQNRIQKVLDERK
ncbi:MAG: extracellular solute-binding protein, partial [Clostridiales bacterium]|nr:extracellular solute-binding protein [Clostridiales bacterium]